MSPAQPAALISCKDTDIKHMRNFLTNSFVSQTLSGHKSNETQSMRHSSPDSKAGFSVHLPFHVGGPDYSAEWLTSWLIKVWGLWSPTTQSWAGSLSVGHVLSSIQMEKGTFLAWVRIYHQYILQPYFWLKGKALRLRAKLWESQRPQEGTSPCVAGSFYGHRKKGGTAVKNNQAASNSRQGCRGPGGITADNLLYTLTESLSPKDSKGDS